jgi:hypothetical protein
MPGKSKRQIASEKGDIDEIAYYDTSRAKELERRWKRSVKNKKDKKKYSIHHNQHIPYNRGEFFRRYGRIFDDNFWEDF